MKPQQKSLEAKHRASLCDVCSPDDAQREKQLAAIPDARVQGRLCIRPRRICDLPDKHSTCRVQILRIRRVFICPRRHNLLALSVLHSDFFTGITHTSVVYFTWYSARIEYVAAHFFCFGWKRICLLMPVDGGYQ